MSDNFDELDELDEIERQGSTSEELVLSNVYNIKIGGFGSNDSIKTYLCTVKVSDLQEDISFYETLTKDKSWPVSQIIQREVDRIRVTNIAKDYILGQGRDIKYFPPIIVAILPKGDDGKIDLSLKFLTDQSEKIKDLIYERSVYRANDKIKKYFLSGENKSLIDGLYLLEVSKIFDFNLLCWDKAKYYAIVIDGQHRLASLYKSRKENPIIGNYTQDVVFIDFSHLIKNSTHDFTPIEAVRRVFIDINTNAKKVGIVRQILMDDKDLASLFVQSMVDAVTKSGIDKQTDSYLTSQIVDWYGESLKHTLPHITGILSLYQIMDDYLIQGNLASIKDLRSQSKVNSWVARMNDIFLVDDKISRLEKYKEVEPLAKSLERYYNKVKDNEEYSYEMEDDNKETEIFSFDYNTLDVAQSTFEEKFLRAIIKVFNEFIPYKLTLNVIEEQGGLNNESILNKALISSRTKLADDKILREKLSELRKLLEDKLYENYYHIFTVLGQKVIFSLLFQRILYSYNSSTTENDILQITQGYINEFNRALEILTIGPIKLFDKRENVQIDMSDVQDHIIDLGPIVMTFWDGIIYEDNKIIYNTQGIKSLSSLIHYILIRIDEIINNKERSRDFVIAYMNQRIKRIIRKRNNTIDDPQLIDYTTEIISIKESFLEKYLNEMTQLWKDRKA